MNYLSVSQMAKKWNMSERGVRKYCAEDKIPGAFLTGKTWNIPENAEFCRPPAAFSDVAPKTVHPPFGAAPAEDYSLCL